MSKKYAEKGAFLSIFSPFSAESLRFRGKPPIKIEILDEIYLPWKKILQSYIWLQI